MGVDDTASEAGGHDGADDSLDEPSRNIKITEPTLKSLPWIKDNVVIAMCHNLALRIASLECG